jgi:hypothetical protein
MKDANSNLASKEAIGNTCNQRLSQLKQIKLKQIKLKQIKLKQIKLKQIKLKQIKLKQIKLKQIKLKQINGWTISKSSKSANYSLPILFGIDVQFTL